MLQFGVAKELGMSLSELRATMTPEEVLGWSAYFQVLNEDQEAELAKARRRRYTDLTKALRDRRGIHL